MMTLIASAAFASEVYPVGMLALLFGLIGIFIERNYDHPAVRALVEKIF
jgi:hypothetical protein